DYRAMLEARGGTNHWRELDPATFAVRDAPRTLTYEEDYRPLDEHGVRDLLHPLQASHAALLAGVAALHAAGLERRPAPDQWSARQALEHVMTSQVKMIGKLERWPVGGFATIEEVHRLVVRRISMLQPDELSREWVIDGQRWSVRRIVRRI